MLTGSDTVAAHSTHTYWPSQKFILSEVHPLYYVPAVIEHSTDVFSVHGTCEVRIAIMLSITACCTYPLQKIYIYYLHVYSICLYIKIKAIIYCKHHTQLLHVLHQ